jgi:flagellar FliL protein
MAEEKKEGEKGDEAAAPATPPKRSSKKMLIIIAGLVGLLLIVGIIVAVMLFSSNTVEEETLGPGAAGGDVEIQEEGIADEDELEEGEEALGALFPLESVIVNLSGGSFLRIQVQFEFMTRDIPKRFYQKLTPLRDGLITVLASKRREDISNKDGRDNLKSEIREMVNDLMRKEDIKNIYFTQFVIQ